MPERNLETELCDTVATAQKDGRLDKYRELRPHGPHGTASQSNTTTLTAKHMISALKWMRNRPRPDRPSEPRPYRSPTTHMRKAGDVKYKTPTPTRQHCQYVYVAQSVCPSAFIKLGKTRCSRGCPIDSGDPATCDRHSLNIDKRRKGLQGGCPYDVRIIGHMRVEDAGREERELHRRFAGIKRTGEWFYSTRQLSDWFWSEPRIVRYGIFRHLEREMLRA